MSKINTIKLKWIQTDEMAPITIVNDVIIAMHLYKYLGYFLSNSDNNDK